MLKEWKDDWKWRMHNGINKDKKILNVTNKNRNIYIEVGRIKQIWKGIENEKENKKGQQKNSK